MQDQLNKPLNFDPRKALDAQPFHSVDRALRGTVARLRSGVSPHSAVQAWADWEAYLAHTPHRQLALVENAQASAIKLAGLWMQAFTFGSLNPAFDSKPYEHRFSDKVWSKGPFFLWQQHFLAVQDWWDDATETVPGMSTRGAERTRFQARQMLDLFAPSNFPLTNPEIIGATFRTGGKNLAEGAMHFGEDMLRTLTQSQKPVPEGFAIGVDIACTPGSVVYRNELFELIQYKPQTAKVQAEPILFISAWIMKYYILDLSPHNSMVNYLVGQGYTVFMISWRNPTAENAEWSLDDYRERGVMAALDAINSILPDVKIHANGYCLGGTMLAITAATMARDGDDRLASVTLMAAQIDFDDVGELLLFIDESQVAFIEDLMWLQGYLDRPKLAKIFASNRAEDSIYTRAIHRYFLGRDDLPSDIGVWHGDMPRMPARVHSEYLRSLFLENRLSTGQFAVEDQVIAINDISVPLFVVATETDHIVPWQSVYKTQLFTDCDLTFVLANRGHNSGIISEPGHKGRHYRIAHRPVGAYYREPKGWCDQHAQETGSWWPELTKWLKLNSSKEVNPPAVKAQTLDDAPGCYVHQI